MIKRKGTENNTLLDNAENQDVFVLCILLAITILLFIVNFWLSSKDQEVDIRNIAHINELRVIAKSLSFDAKEIYANQEDAFNSLRKNRHEFRTRLITLKNGDTSISSAKPVGELLKREFKILHSTWNQTDQLIDSIFARKTIIATVDETMRESNKLLPILQLTYEDIVSDLIKINTDSRQTAIAVRQSWQFESIARNLDNLIHDKGDTLELIKSLMDKAKFFNKVLLGMLNGNSSLRITKITQPNIASKLERFIKDYTVLLNQIDIINSVARELYDVRFSINKVYFDSQLLVDLSVQLISSYTALTKKRILGFIPGIILGVLAFIIMLIIGMRTFLKSKNRLILLKAQKKNHQVAINRLQNEIADLGNGNLTVRASKTSELTTPIANTFNFTIDALRKLVVTINEMTMQVEKASLEGEKVTDELAKASDQQIKAIIEVSKSVNDMALSIDQVSANANESRDVATKSLEYAKNGAKVVNDTVASMEKLREKNQQTAKRLKRLGESSQEIGDILTLISDIGEQTNVLALNAAIQAAMAGEQGQGFAAVADEVQQLSEKSSNATKQIATLVETIQTDMVEAIESMEKSTAEVVNGTQLAHDAGSALEKIENVSNQLATIIQHISDTASVQSITSAEIANTMNVIQDITNQTASGVSATTKAVSALSAQSKVLSNSVSGFKISS